MVPSFVCLIALLAPAVAKAHSLVDPSVVGGFDADIADFPFQLSLQVAGTHSCGATLVSTTRAVTAAHCATGLASDYVLLGGTSDRTDTTCATCVLIPVTSITVHPEFVNSGSNGYPNDIAILQFDETATNANLQPAELSVPDDGSLKEESGVITGWGRTAGEIPDLPIILQQANVTIMSNARCIDGWSASQINPGNICVEALDVSGCSGDSGSPLVCSGKLAGIYSWSSTTCSTALPSVYTRISHYYDWIITTQ